MVSKTYPGIRGTWQLEEGYVSHFRNRGRADYYNSS